MIKLAFWVVVGLIALGLLGQAMDSGAFAGRAAPSWDGVEVTTYKQDCEEEGDSTYMAIGRNVTPFEQPCSSPPPERLR